ncbi:MAG: hypothetical protein R6V50_00525 [Thermoplasmatota archaeon]
MGWKMSYKPITVKFDELLYNQINKHELSNSEMIRKSCQLFLELQKQNKNIDQILNELSMGNTITTPIDNTQGNTGHTNGNTQGNTGHTTHSDTSINEEQNIPEHIYSQMYSELYNIEVLPLKNQVNYLNQIINMLKDDKQYLQQQNNALILAKHPLLTRLKIALLPSKHKTES